MAIGVVGLVGFIELLGLTGFAWLRLNPKNPINCTTQGPTHPFLGVHITSFCPSKNLMNAWAEAMFRRAKYLNRNSALKR